MYQSQTRTQLGLAAMDVKYARRSQGHILVALCLFLLLICGTVRKTFAESSAFELDPSEIEALGLEEDEASPSAEPTSWAEEFGDEEFPTGGHEDDDPEVVVSDPDVVVVSSSNFSQVLASNKFVMVEFYAPWCGHCQALAPEYARAATELKPDGVILAKVDATQEKDLAALHDIQGYPTMIFFIDGKPKPYSHLRNSEAIVSWIKKKMGPPVDVVVSKNDAQSILDSGHTIVVGFFDKAEGPEVAAFAATAQQEEDVAFYQASNRDVANVFHISQNSKAPVVVLIKREPEKVVFYDGIFEESSLMKFVLANKLPLVSKFTRDSAVAIFESPIKRQMLLFASPEDANGVLPAFEAAAKEFKGEIIFVHIDASDEEVGKPVATFFGISVEKPKIVGFMVSDSESTKYLLEEEATLENIKEFASSFIGGKLKAFYKSEPIPVKNDEDVKIVVGNNFDEIVLDESKDVLLEIYAPWCGHCQALEPVYNKLAKALSNVDSLVIAKMDGTANEHPRGKADGYPTLLFFPAGNKTSEPVVVETDRSVKGLYQFLKKHATIPFTIAKKNANEQSQQPTEKVDSSSQLKDEL